VGFQDQGGMDRFVAGVSNQGRGTLWIDKEDSSDSLAGAVRAGCADDRPTGWLSGPVARHGAAVFSGSRPHRSRGARSELTP